MLRQHTKILGYTTQILDLLSLISAFFLSFPVRELVIRHLPYGEKIEFQTFSVLLFIFLFIWWIVLKWQGAYGYQRLISFKSFAVKAFQASILGMLVLFSIIYMAKWKEVPRTLILTLSSVAFLTLIIEKLFWLKFLEYLRKKGRGLCNVLIVA